MKTQTLLFGAVVAAFGFTAFATEPLLSPRAAGNQIKVAGEPVLAATTVFYVAPRAAQLSPRAAGNPIKVVQGIAEDAANPALVCRETMPGSPKAVTECSSHSNMPGCMAAR